MHHSDVPRYPSKGKSRIPERWFVYGMADPRTNLIRCITMSGGEYKLGNVRMVSPSRSPRYLWRVELDKLGLEPLLVLLKECSTREEAVVAKREFIAKLKAQLLN